MADSWVGYEDDGAIRYELSLKRVGESNNFLAIFALPQRNYMNYQNFKFVSLEDGEVAFKRSNGDFYRAKLVENGSKLIDGTRGNKEGNISSKFKNWELAVVK